MTAQGLSCQLTQNDHHQITQLLMDLGRGQLLCLAPALGLSYARFRGIEEHTILLGDIISGWLRMEDGVVTTPCWAVLITALEEIGQNGIATRIRQTVEEQISRPPSNLLASPDSETQAFSGGAEASASCLQTRFPYLNTEHLSQEGKNILIGRLEAESKGIEQKFAALVITTAKSLEARRITVERVIILLKSCGITFEPTSEYRNIDHVLITAVDHWSFFNHRILEALINCLGDGTDRERLAIYKSNFKEYCKRRLCEVPVDALRSDRTVTTRLHVKVDRHWNIPVEDVYLLAQVLSDLLDTTMLLLNVEEGCIKIDFDCRYLEEDDLLPLLGDDHKDVFMQLGIMKLYTDRQVFYEQIKESDNILEVQASGDNVAMIQELIKLKGKAKVAKAVWNNLQANGLAVIITNDYKNCPKQDIDAKQLDHLQGTFKDGQNLYNAFSSLKFAVHWERNVDTAGLGRIVQEIKQLKYANVRNYRCIVFIFAGHGCEGDRLCMQDGRTVDLYEDVVNPLLPESAREIGSIQKVFLIDACRGSEVMPTTLVPRAGSSSSSRDGSQINTSRVASKGGYMLAYSTLPRCKAFERREAGGIWLSTIAKMILAKKFLGSFEHLLTEVNCELKEQMQDSSAQFQQLDRWTRLNGHICLDPDIPVNRPKLAAVFPSENTVANSGTCVEAMAAHEYLTSIAITSGSIAISSQPHPQPITLNPSQLRPVPTSYLPVSSTPPANPGSRPQPCFPTVNPNISTNLGSRPQPSANLSASVNPGNNPPVSLNTPANIRNTQLSFPGCNDSPNYRAQLNDYFQKNGVTPKYEYIEDSAKGAPVFKCIITYMMNGVTQRKGSGGFFVRKDDAKEKAAYNIMSSLSHSRGGSATTTTTSANVSWKQKLKEYYDKQGKPGMSFNYRDEVSPTKDSFRSHLLLPEIGREVGGEWCRSKKEAQQSAAKKALQCLK